MNTKELFRFKDRRGVECCLVSWNGVLMICGKYNAYHRYKNGVLRMVVVASQEGMLVDC